MPGLNSPDGGLPNPNIATKPTIKPAVKPRTPPPDLSRVQSLEDLAKLNSEGNKPSLEEQLRVAFDKNFTALGHGTRVEKIDDILNDGLKTRFPELESTTIPIFDNSKTYDEQSQQVVDKITHWPHLDSKAIVIVMIPNAPADAKVGGKRYFNSVMQEIPKDQQNEYAQYVVPPRYVKGIFNVDTNQFIENPNFDPVVPEVKLQKSNPFPKHESPTEPISVPQPTGESVSPDDMVW